MSKAVKPKKRKRKKKLKVVVSTAKRKRAIARAVVKEGKGTIKINKKGLEDLNPYHREFLMLPLSLIGKKAEKIDVEVNVKGGGISGQIQASRTAIARALVSFFGDEKLEQRMWEIDRYLLGNDVRRVEPKKDRARKARAKYQTSYR